jgi:iron complex transport system substrate-binding protein
MAAGTKRLIVVALLATTCASISWSAQAQPGRARRIVSLVPALTEMLFAIGAGSQVVGVGSFDAFPPEVKNLPRVGALLDPDVERILSLRPELVITYGSQTDLQRQFARAGVKTYSYRHGGIDTILQSMRELGDATGHVPEADRIVSGLRDKLAAIRARVKGRTQPNVLLVIDRQPKTLREIYVSGGFGFLHEMLEIAGGRNVFSDVKRESVQPSHETLIARAPQVIVELQAEGMIAPSDIAADKATWSTLSSLPAVRNGRVHILVGQYLVVPGPRFADAVETLARTLHPDSFNLLR